MALDYNFKMIGDQGLTTKTHVNVSGALASVNLRVQYFQTYWRLVFKGDYFGDDGRVIIQAGQAPLGSSSLHWSSKTGSSLDTLNNGQIDVDVAPSVCLKIIFTQSDAGLYARMGFHDIYNINQGPVLRGIWKNQLLIDNVSFNILKHRIKQANKLKRL